jgi:hypothetical protein
MSGQQTCAPESSSLCQRSVEAGTHVEGNGIGWFVGWFSLFFLSLVLLALGIKFLASVEARHIAAGSILCGGWLVLFIILMVALHRKANRRERNG